MISEKQMKILAFPYSQYDALICDGAVRSGKTSLMMVAFIDWAMRTFNRQNFGVCGKTVTSTDRNIIRPYTSLSWARDKYTLRYNRSDHVLTVKVGEKENYFYVFGGKDEGSADLIQGITLAGILLDEVALMPRSFVDQALARCSVDDSKVMFSCNPESPTHWFYQEWICEYERHNALYLHFIMNDNPSLSEEKLKQYETTFSGVFYDRFVLGKWVKAEGIVYPMLDKEKHVINNSKLPEKFEEYNISMDYGIQNATCMDLWGSVGNKHYCIAEYYHSGRDTGKQKTDEEYYDELVKLARDLPIRWVIIDPSATSFIVLIRKKGKFKVRKANNAVIDGIQCVASALKQGLLFIHEDCENTLSDVEGYMWDDKGEDQPIKIDDHGADSVRYYCYTKKITKLKQKYNSPFGG